ncbi:MAG: PKD domain-containing protein [Crocinitomicaceae bacterium]
MKNIESKFKDALSNHEVDYNPQAWDAFKQRLEGQSIAQPNGGSKTLAKLGIAATVVGIMSFGAYFILKGSSTDSQNASNPKGSAKVIENPKLEEHGIKKDENTNPSIHVDPSDNGGHSLENQVEHQADLIDLKKEEQVTDLRKENVDDPFNFDHDPDLSNGNQNIIKETNNVISPEDKLVLNANFTASTMTGCEGMVCQFTPKQNESYKGDYIWDFGDGTYSKERNPVHKYNREGNYVVKLALRSEINNEVISDQAQEYITVYANPKADFEIEESSVNAAIPEFDFINMTNSGTDWTWDFGDNSGSVKKDPSHTYRKKGIYKVTLTAQNDFGCQSKVTKNITVEDDYNLLAPTGFTPNGDGLNDNFIPKALEIMNAEFTMSIYHKNGQMYYKTNQVSRPWDGRYMMDNQNAPAGAYVWVVQLKNKNGETEVYRGSVTLLRD